MWESSLILCCKNFVAADSLERWSLAISGVPLFSQLSCKSSVFVTYKRLR